MSAKIFMASQSANRIASVTLRVKSSDLQDLEDYYITKVGFTKVDQSHDTPKITTLSIPQGIFPKIGHVSAALKLNPVALKGFFGGKPSDIYWKIGLQLHDVDGAAKQMGYPPGSQFMDIGYMKHIQDPVGFPIELLQTTFEANKQARQLLFGDKTKKEYQQLIKDKFTSLGSSIAAHQPLTMGQITIRISDDKKALAFYEGVLGMKLVSIQDVSAYGFRLFFLVYTADEPPCADLNDVSIREWLWHRRYTQLELQWKFNSSKLTHNGYSTPEDDVVHLPSGLDSIQVEINEEHILNRVKQHETFKESDPGTKPVIVAVGEEERILVGTVRDPDGCQIEIITSALTLTQGKS